MRFSRLVVCNLRLSLVCVVLILSVLLMSIGVLLNSICLMCM